MPMSAFTIPRSRSLWIIEWEGDQYVWTLARNTDRQMRDEHWSSTEVVRATIVDAETKFGSLYRFFREGRPVNQVVNMNTIRCLQAVVVSAANTERSRREETDGVL